MKLVTLKDGSRDGMLAVVSRDLKTAHLADGIAPTMQRALDDWNFIAPQLEELSLQLGSVYCGILETRAWRTARRHEPRGWLVEQHHPACGSIQQQRQARAYGLQHRQRIQRGDHRRRGILQALELAGELLRLIRQRFAAPAFSLPCAKRFE